MNLTTIDSLQQNGHIIDSLIKKCAIVASLKLMVGIVIKEGKITPLCASGLEGLSTRAFNCMVQLGHGSILVMEKITSYSTI